MKGPFEGLLHHVTQLISKRAWRGCCDGCSKRRVQGCSCDLTSCLEPHWCLATHSTPAELASSRSSTRSRSEALFFVHTATQFGVTGVCSCGQLPPGERLSEHLVMEGGHKAGKSPCAAPA